MRARPATTARAGSGAPPYALAALSASWPGLLHDTQWARRWDCHGLPVEYEIDKKLSKSRAQSCVVAAIKPALGLHIQSLTHAPCRHHVP
jgi:hypothetical protein